MCHREQTYCNNLRHEVRDYNKFVCNDYWNDDISVYCEYSYHDDNDCCRYLVIRNKCKNCRLYIVKGDRVS